MALCAVHAQGKMAGPAKNCNAVHESHTKFKNNYQGALNSVADDSAHFVSIVPHNCLSARCWPAVIYTCSRVCPRHHNPLCGRQELLTL